MIVSNNFSLFNGTSETLALAEKKGMLLYGYVIMNNHIHLIVQSRTGNLSDLIRDFKKFTAKNILEKIQTEPESRREWMLERFKKQQKHMV